MSSGVLIPSSVVAGLPGREEVVARPPGVSTSGLERLAGCGLCASDAPPE